MDGHGENKNPKTHNKRSSSTVSRASSYTHDNIFMRVPSTVSGEDERVPLYRARMTAILHDLDTRLESKRSNSSGGSSRT